MYTLQVLNSTNSPKHRILEKDQPHRVPYIMESKTNSSIHGKENELDEKLRHIQVPQKKLCPRKLELEVVTTVDDESYLHLRTLANGSKGETLQPSSYFNSMKGPELEVLKNPKHSVLPTNKKWPFLLRFPINCFGINLGLGSQAILWKILASEGHIWFMQVPILVNIVVWSLATLALILTTTIYTFKIIFYFEAVRREFDHPIRNNFFFAPWIACMLLALGVPPPISIPIPPSIWILFVVPVFALNLKIYGEWISGGERRLCKVANPCTHLSLLGNFVGALLIATIGYTELALFFWSIGFLHYLVLLVTLYQRLPSATMLPKELHPVYFLFVALPSSASISWAKIMGKFDLSAKIIYFFALFLFFSLVARAKIFYGFRFNIAWWAYTFPLTVSAIAAIEYSLAVKHPLTQTLAGLLTLLSSMIVLSLAFTTILHTFLWKTMFPNDMAIALESNGIKAKRRIKALKEDLLPL